MRFVLILGIIIGLHASASATCFTPQQCTIDSATVYLGGAPWDVRCQLEIASWDPQQQAYTCIAHSQSLDISGGVAYVEMEYATTTASDGSVWPYLPNWITYWWPSKQNATAWLTAYQILDSSASWEFQDARITRTYHYCDQTGLCSGYINYTLDPGDYYISCDWRWPADGLPHIISCRVGQGTMR